MQETKVCIIGGGPAGAMAALRLAKDKIPFVLIEKDVFPRDKICGDALSGKVPHIIRRLSPGLFESFESACNPLQSYGIRFIAPGDHVFDVPFIQDFDPETHPVPGYTVKREVFDDFMLKEVKKHAEGVVFEGEGVGNVERFEDGFLVSTAKQQLKVNLLIDASGHRSSFDGCFHRPNSSASKTALAVRTYYEGVTELHPQNFIELYFLEDVLPGYIWVFPMQGGLVNVGVGIRKDVVLRKKVNLHAKLEEMIRSHPALALRFKNAVQVGKPAAHPLPLGFPRFRISGERYMLAGDAAHLVDPLTGEGVGNALYSGYIAAEQVVDCLKEGRFDAAFMKAYDERIKRVLGKEMKISASFQRMLKYPRMVRWIARRADGNKHIPGLMSSMFTDLDHRKKLLNPVFIMRVLLNR